jgi:hypothetical protein
MGRRQFPCGTADWMSNRLITYKQSVLRLGFPNTIREIIREKHGKIKNAHNDLSEDLKRRDHLGSARCDGRMIYKWLLNKNVVNIQNIAGSGSSPAERICDCSYDLWTVQ